MLVRLFLQSYTFVLSVAFVLLTLYYTIIWNFIDVTIKRHTSSDEHTAGPIVTSSPVTKTFLQSVLLSVYCNIVVAQVPHVILWWNVLHHNLDSF